MNIGSAYPGERFKVSDLEANKSYKLIISAVVIEEVGGDNGNEKRPVVYFKNTRTEKGLVLDRPNAMTIKKLYGSETDDWIGEPIILYATRVKAPGDVHLIIKVSAPEGI